MTEFRSRIDRLAVGLARSVIARPFAVIAACLAVTMAIAAGASGLGIANNYRVFFSTDNPELVAFETFQATYTKNDNIQFVLLPESGDVFTPETLAAVEALTEAAWQI
ncbi:MAG: RND transporter, partial [Pseudomonadota bacterium]